MDAINDMFQKGMADYEGMMSPKIKAQILTLATIGDKVKADTTVWNCLDSCLCSRKALQIKYMICTRYVFNYGSVN